MISHKNCLNSPFNKKRKKKKNNVFGGGGKFAIIEQAKTIETFFVWPRIRDFLLTNFN